MQNMSEAPSPYESFISLKHFGSLDGLRCLSILAVLWNHSRITSDIVLLNQGQLGVFLFFGISGFLITSLIIREKTNNGFISLRKFYIRRSLRIFPLYYATILLYVIAVFVMERDSEVGRDFYSNLIWFVTYTSNWFVTLHGSERIIFYFAWSLAVEEQFYLSWPWIEKYCQSKVKFILLFIVTLIVFINHIGLLLWLIPADSFMHKVLWSLAPPILLGVASAHMMHNEKFFNAAYRVLGNRIAAPLLLLVIIAMASVQGDMYWTWLIYTAMVLLVVACTINENNGLAPILKARLVARFGVISYGIYLLHMLCFNAVWSAASHLGIEQPWLSFFIGIVVVYVVAEISFRTFEAFFQSLRPRLYKRFS